MKNRSHRQNRTSPKHGHKYTKYKMFLSMMVMRNKQHLSYI